jgi:hypothetical protein
MSSFRGLFVDFFEKNSIPIAPYPTKWELQGGGEGRVGEERAEVAGGRGGGGVKEKLSLSCALQFYILSFR